MEKKDKHRIDRREFLKRLGAGVTAVSATTVAGCSFRDAGTGGRARGEVPTDKMTYRTADFATRLWLYALAYDAVAGWNRRSYRPRNSQ